MLIYCLSLIGVAVFAITGALAAGRKGLDWVGVLALAFATSVGGGTLRDILLNRETIFWIETPDYVWVIILSSALTIIYTRFFKPPVNTLLIADAFGLALFTIIGAQIAEGMGVSPIVVVIMGVITGSAGGVIRDIFTDEIPLLFRADEPLYSTASVAGLLIYLGVKHLDFNTITATLSGIAVIIIIRLCAIFWKITLPAFHINKK